MAELPSDEILYILNKINCTFTLGWKDSKIYLIFLLLFAISSNPCLKMWLVIFFFICGFKIYQVLTVFASSSFGRKKVVALIFFIYFCNFLQSMSENVRSYYLFPFVVLKFILSWQFLLVFLWCRRGKMHFIVSIHLRKVAPINIIGTYMNIYINVYILFVCLYP